MKYLGERDKLAMENTSQRMNWISQPQEDNESIYDMEEFEIEVDGLDEESSEEIDTHDEDEDGDEIECPEGQEKKNEVDDGKPRVGMVFESEEHGFQYYCNYAREMGFKVRKGGVRKSKKNDDVIGRRLYCSKEGFREERFKKLEACRKRHNPETRTGCQAKLLVNRAENGTWVVSMFVEKHNHKFESPTKLKGGGKVEFMMQSFSEDARGRKDLCPTGKDARNYLGTKRTKDFEIGDVQALLNYLSDMQLENPYCWYAVQLDLNGQITNFIWADARSRIDYGYFGDVVCFDTSYGTSAYSIPFVPIFGVNHHLQTILFGCVLVLDETEDSLVWALETWMKAMKGCHPKVIFTNEDSAVTSAIAHVLPHSHHRFCLWNIFRNAKKRLNHLFGSGCDFGKDFSYCVRGCETIEEFELGWKFLLTKYNLQDNEWMKRLYFKRQQWVPVFSRDLFCGDMLTTQRSKRVRKFFKGHLSRDMSLEDFARGVEKAVISWRKKETEVDSHMNQVHPSFVVRMYIGEEAAKIYTAAVFLEFQKELISSLRYMCEKIEDDGTVSIYKLWMLERKNRQYIVKFSSRNICANCSCQKFESMGFLCRHILKVFFVTNVHYIPPQYILNRWTKDAKCGAVVYQKGEQLQVGSQVRYSNLCHQAINVAIKGASSKEIYKVAKFSLQRAQSEVENAMRRQATESIGSKKNDNVTTEKETHTRGECLSLLPYTFCQQQPPSSINVDLNDLTQHDALAPLSEQS
uniref:Protein FAR1-RELATED SEQUENCE n=1 Tax=Nelumbo nucifera TaxID=4432 RepID=A0A822ZXZ5_NELNU|nr:TPA_asm: hypothetical protein HUJ06_017653 [Nelumbo nucifera]